MRRQSLLSSLRYRAGQPARRPDIANRKCDERIVPVLVHQAREAGGIGFSCRSFALCGSRQAGKQKQEQGCSKVPGAAKERYFPEIPSVAREPYHHDALPEHKFRHYIPCLINYPQTTVAIAIPRSARDFRNSSARDFRKNLLRDRNST